MLPSHRLHQFDIVISHGFQAIDEVAGPFPLACPGRFCCARTNVGYCKWRAFLRACFPADGVTEARNAHDEEFGIERLGELCRSCYANPPPVLLEHLFATLEEFTGTI